MNFFLKRRDELSKKNGKLISQHKIAIALDVTPALIGKWERGELVPSLRMAAEIARVYEVPLERIEQEIVKLNRDIAKRVPASSAD